MRCAALRRVAVWVTATLCFARLVSSAVHNEANDNENENDSDGGKTSRRALFENYVAYVAEEERG